MPKDDNTTTTQTTTTTQQPAVTAPPIPMVEDVAPPMIPDIQTSTTTTTTSQPVSDTGSAAPADDIVMPTTVIASTPKKKYAGGKVIATILGLLLLVGGTGAGIYLVGQNQNIEELAVAPGACVCNTVQGNPTPGKCRTDGTCECPAPYDERNNKCDENENTKDDLTPAEKNARCEYLSGKSQQGQEDGCSIKGKTCTAEFLSDCSNWGGKPPKTPTPPAITASCQNVKAYSETWTLLTAAQLSALKPADKVNFCVAGTATGGSFNKARFTINNVLQAETTTVRPSSTDFCQLYTIPPATTSFNVTAQINHVTQGWK